MKRHPVKIKRGSQFTCAVGSALAVLFLLVFLTFGDPEYPRLGEKLHLPATAEELSLVTFTEIERQMRHGTTGVSSTPNRASWASQPGAIRIFSDGDGEILKLYSAAEMRVPGSTDLSADVPADWDAQPDHFVDLNTPINEPDESLVFPIADPRSFSGSEDGAEGFSYTGTINGVVLPDAPGGSHDAQRLPMPVRWRYVLRNGNIGTLDDANRWVGTGAPSESNPIVGRVAYWTDDLSCRINVNTAAEGAYWDTPRADTLEERSYAEMQPARDEFQRQPGHPATVCLSSVLFPNQRYYLPETSGALDSLPLADAEELWRIAPGVGTGGSRGGTVRIAEDEPPVDADPVDYHLYKSLEDVIGSNPSLSAPVAGRVRRAEFLLTTDSNAPETTLMGFPKIAMWPVPASVEQRSAFDQRIAEVATLQDSSYFYQRESTTSLHWELYNVADLNNAKLFDFMRGFGRLPFPGYAGTSLGNKYSNSFFGDWAQLSLALHGYVRSMNLSDPTAPVPYTPTPDLAGHGQLLPLCNCGGETNHRSIWWQRASPYPLSGGRSNSISEVALVWIVSGHVDASGGTYGDSDGLLPGKSRFEIGLVLETFCPGHGYTQIRPLSRLVGASTLTAGSSDPEPIPLKIDFQELVSNKIDCIADSSPSLGGSGGSGIFSKNTDGESLGWSRRTNAGKSFLLDAPSMMLKEIGDGRFGFDLLLQDGTSGSSSSIWRILRIGWDRSIPVEIPAPQLPVDLSKIGTWTERIEAAADAPQSLLQDGDVVRSFVTIHGDSRVIDASRVPQIPRGLSGTTLFKRHPDFSNLSEPMSHSLVDANGRPLYGSKAGRALVSGAAYPPEVRPDFPISPDSADYLMYSDETLELDPSVTGDFDNGFARSPDGAYTNHPDPGVYFADGTPYFDQLDDTSKTNAAVFAPQRIMPGPGMMGSLPTGGSSGIPWRTLLFRPDPQHYGSGGTPDHIVLDQFWMPVPEPHGISHDFSTDGKINMNYAIAPFSHIRRATALHALFKAEKMMAIPTSAAPVYKTQTSTESWRNFIDTEQTLQQFEERFSTGGIFRSSSEICEQYLVPEGQLLGTKVDGDYPDMRAFWEEHKLTGDNVKERPHTNLHSRLTTKSNHFKIYAIVQAITKDPASAQDVFDPGVDTVHEATPISATLRRLLDGTPDCSAFDPTNQGFPDYLVQQPAVLPGLDDFYRYSITDSEPQLRSLPEIEEVSRADTGEVTIRWRSRNADVFVVERSTDLGGWQVIDPYFGGTDPWAEFVDTSPPSGGKVYYRVRLR